MRASTHFVAGYVLATAIGGNQTAALISGLCAILPDIDYPYSTTGRKTPVLPHLLKHRGITHSLFMNVLIYMLVNFYVGNSCALYCGIGWASHLLLDALNPAGIELFWPLHKKIGIGVIKTGSIFEYLFVGIVVLLSFNKLV